MTPTVVLPVVVGALVAAGVWLMTTRHLTRVVLGVVLLGNGVNLLLLSAGGPAGRAPIAGSGQGPVSDPLPQAMVLTAIVITLGITAFLLALSHRTATLTGDDEVGDDDEDRRVRGDDAL